MIQIGGWRGRKQCGQKYSTNANLTLLPKNSILRTPIFGTRHNNNILRRFPRTRPFLFSFAISGRKATYKNIWRNWRESIVFCQCYPAPNYSISRTTILRTRLNNDTSKRFPYTRPFLLCLAISVGDETHEDFRRNWGESLVFRNWGGRHETAFRAHQFFELALIITLLGAIRTRAPSTSVSLLVMEKMPKKIFEEIDGDHLYFAVVTRRQITAICAHQFLEHAETCNISMRFPYTHPLPFLFRY